MGSKLKVEKVRGGHFTLKSLEEHEINEEDILNKIEEEESQFYVKARGDREELVSFDYTGIFKDRRYVYPESVFAETEIKNNYRIKLYSSNIAPLKRTSLEELAKTLKAYSNFAQKKKIAIAYSGGLDSSLLAWVFREREPLLITVGFEESEDIKVSKQRAKLLGLEQIVHKIEVKELKDSLRQVYDLGYTIMDLALSAGFYLAGKIARENGADIIIVGQLADELFGGYRKYHALPLDFLENVLYEDIKKAIAGMRRDTKAIISAGVEPAYPYAFKSFFRMARALPSIYKVDKFGLRKIGEILGLPNEIINARKKAFQYGSRIEKEIKNLLH
mgnify:CR=1 FL=1